MKDFQGQLLGVKDSTDEELVFYLEGFKVKFTMREFSLITRLHHTPFPKSSKLINESHINNAC